MLKLRFSVILAVVLASASARDTSRLDDARLLDLLARPSRVHGPVKKVRQACVSGTSAKLQPHGTRRSKTDLTALDAHVCRAAWSQRSSGKPQAHLGLHASLTLPSGILGMEHLLWPWALGERIAENTQAVTVLPRPLCTTEHRTPSLPTQGHKQVPSRAIPGVG